MDHSAGVIDRHCGSQLIFNREGKVEATGSSRFSVYQVRNYPEEQQLCFSVLHLSTLLIYKYYIPERVIVRNVTLRNMIINRGEAEVDNRIPEGDISDYDPLRNVIFILLYRTFISLRRKSAFAYLNSEKIGPMSKLY